MNLKVEDALKSLSRTDPESVACRDLGVIFPAACSEKSENPFAAIPRPLAAR